MPVSCRCLVRLVVEKKRGLSEEKKKAAIDRGILYTSGMIAGEGLVGILLAVFAVVELDLTKLLGGFSLGQIGAISHLLSCSYRFTVQSNTVFKKKIKIN